MKKKIEAVSYFIDMGIVSLLAILGFSIGINKWLGVIGIMGITLFSIFTSVHIENKI